MSTYRVRVNIVRIRGSTRDMAGVHTQVIEALLGGHQGVKVVEQLEGRLLVL